MEQEYFKFNWQKAVISEHGPDKTTRFILLVLSIFMDMKGICFPSTVSISEAAGVSLRSVITHLEKAEQSGWIKKMVAGFNGQGWKRNKYTAIIPGKVVQEVHCLDQKGSATDDIKVVQELHSNKIKNKPKDIMPQTNELFLNVPLKNGTEYSIYKNDIKAWQESFPNVDVSQELRSLRQWNIDNPLMRKTHKGFRRHVNGWLSSEQKKGKTTISRMPRN